MLDYKGIKEKQVAAEAFCAANLRTCCEELVEWATTSVLRDGKVRELAAMFTWADEIHQLRIAEATVKHAAMMRLMEIDKGE